MTLGDKKDPCQTASCRTVRCRNIIQALNQAATDTDPSRPRFLLLFFKQAIIDCPTTGVARQPFAFKHLTLTKLTVPGLPRVAARDITVNDGQRGPVRIKENQMVLIATSRAAMDPVAYPNPEVIDPHRPLSSYTLLGHGLHYCFGARMVAPALVATLKEVFKLKNLRRAPGKQGGFSTVEHQFAGVNMRVYLDANSKENPIPTTMTLLYDEDSVMNGDVPHGQSSYH